MGGEQSPPAASPTVGRDTDEMLRAQLGPSAPQPATLSKRGVIRTRENEREAE